MGKNVDVLASSNSKELIPNNMPNRSENFSNHLPVSLDIPRTT